MNWSPRVGFDPAEMEYELLDTGIFHDDRYFDVFVEYAKDSAEDLLIQISVFNRGPEPATIECASYTYGFATPGHGGLKIPNRNLKGYPTTARQSSGHHTLNWESGFSIAREGLGYFSPKTKQTTNESLVPQIAVPS